MKRFLAPVAALLIAALVAAVIVLSVREANQSARDQRATNHQICSALNNLNSVITQTLNRSKKNLDRLSYYRAHPKEKAEQEYEIERTLLLFRPRRCG